MLLNNLCAFIYVELIFKNSQAFAYPVRNHGTLLDEGQSCITTPHKLGRHPPVSTALHLGGQAFVNNVTVSTLCHSL